MQQMTAQQRGEWAKNLLSNPAFEDSFETLQNYFIAQMVATKPHEKDIRDHLHLRILTLRDIKSCLTAFVNKGKLEKIREVNQKEMGNDKPAAAETTASARRNRRSPKPRG